MLINDPTRQATYQAIALIALLAFFQEGLKKRQQGVFLEEALQGNAWLARDASSKRFEMGWNDLLKWKVGLPEQLLESRCRASVSRHELVPGYTGTERLVWQTLGEKMDSRHVSDIQRCQHAK